ncbi:hypothetical protein SAMN05428961_106319 [Paenibacillus sp. OK060]|uniref:permease prefix domain 1-containing protein n=1 Tax=Paenibacillus sp. OK060 TaxID=1881034 RepID=UPI00088F3DA4|nr:permease prefix domain 1-containing protein [Paenibacillus sp. OK060]SDL73595.1 hypothetical protein SAMN05428961_106319 [Paenibacillus sp. OK060]
MDIQSYLNQVFRNSFLSKKERTDLTEEMAAHLNSSKERYINEGCSSDQATKKALESFGNPISIREKLTKETFGLSSSVILGLICISGFLFVSSLILGIIANHYGIHNRVIELFPVLFITICAICGALLLTRRNIDRLCLVSVPFLFGLGYLQAYLGLFKNMLGGIESFNLFENLFFSGAYDFSGRSSFMLIGGFIITLQTIAIFILSKNIYISVMPFLFSVMYTISHMLVIGMYYLFLSNGFISQVTNGYNVFVAGNIQRLTDIGIKLGMCIVLFLILNTIKKIIAKRTMETV